MRKWNSARGWEFDIDGHWYVLPWVGGKLTPEEAERLLPEYFSLVDKGADTVSIYKKVPWYNADGVTRHMVSSGGVKVPGWKYEAVLRYGPLAAVQFKDGYPEPREGWEAYIGE